MSSPVDSLFTTELDDTPKAYRIHWKTYIQCFVAICAILYAWQFFHIKLPSPYANIATQGVAAVILAIVIQQYTSNML